MTADQTLERIKALREQLGTLFFPANGEHRAAGLEAIVICVSLHTENVNLKGCLDDTEAHHKHKRGKELLEIVGLRAENVRLRQQVEGMGVELFGLLRAVRSECGPYELGTDLVSKIDAALAQSEKKHD